MTDPPENTSGAAHAHIQDTIISAQDDVYSMNVTLLKALIVFVPVCILFAWSLISFVHGKAVGSGLQLLGAGCLVAVVLTHVCEALHLLPFMHWGSPSSLGHALDLWSAALGLTLCPLGYLWTRVTRQQTT